jgi:hypothetical protein
LPVSTPRNAILFPSGLKLKSPITPSIDATLTGSPPSAETFQSSALGDS